MDPYLNDWLNLILRFVHLVTGIAWIGASFYFIWLDNHLQDPPAAKKDKGIKGDLWAIHGGGFYEVAKYQLAPETLPSTLHWFKWEAYSTWISGFLLLSLMYYAGANVYLIDPGVMQLAPAEAVGLGLLAIVGGWFVYDQLCESQLAAHGLFLGCLLLLLVCLLAFGLSSVFSARGAYIHIGAVIGTMMVGNVFRVIIPSQKALVDAVENGTAPDPTWAQKAKLRSTHNTYATLPVLFIMISNHYPMIYNHEYNWLVLLAIVMLSAAARHYFVLRHKSQEHVLWLLAPAVGTLMVAFLIMPERQHSVPIPDPGVASQVDTVSDAELMEVIARRCATCHATRPVDDVFKVAPLGIAFDSLADVRRWAQRIEVRTLQSRDMPMMNKTAMTDKERQLLGQWLSQDTTSETDHD